MKDHEGWRVFNITTPEGVNFNMGFKDGTLRIRKSAADGEAGGEYWQPIDITVDAETLTTIKIQKDDFGTPPNTYETVPGKHVESEEEE